MCPSLRLKIVKSCNLFLAFFGIGLNVSIIGPTLLDLQSMVKRVDHNGVIFSTRIASYSAGSLLGGVAIDYFSKKQTTLIIFYLLASVGTLAIPWSGYLEVLAFLMCLTGCTIGAFVSGGNIWCLHLWGEHHGPFLQAIYFAVGLGTLVAPIMAAPFLSPYSLIDLQALATNYTNQTVIHHNETELKYHGFTPQQSVLYIYSIIGGYTLLVTILIYIVFLISPEESFSSKTVTQIKDLKMWKLGLVIALSFLIVLSGNGITIGFAQVLTTYVAEGPHRLSKSTGSYMTSVFWGAFTLSTGVSSFLIKKLKAIPLTAINMVVALIATILLLIFGMSEEWSLWLGMALLGYGIAPLLPCSLSWTKEFAVMNSKISGFYVLAQAGGGIFVLLLIVNLMNAIPQIPFYMIFISKCICFIGLLLLYYLTEKVI